MQVAPPPLTQCAALAVRPGDFPLAVVVATALMVIRTARTLLLLLLLLLLTPPEQVFKKVMKKELTQIDIAKAMFHALTSQPEKILGGKVLFFTLFKRNAYIFLAR